jgi:hypothetical protein
MLSSPDFCRVGVEDRPASVSRTGGPLCLVSLPCKKFGINRKHVAVLCVANPNRHPVDLQNFELDRQRIAQKPVAYIDFLDCHGVFHSFAIPVSGVAGGLSEVPVFGGCRLRTGATGTGGGPLWRGRSTPLNIHFRIPLIKPPTNLLNHFFVI